MTGKIVAITGASSGIGEATARLLSERGATVVLGARRTDRLDALAADLPCAAIVCHADVMHRGDLERLVARAVGSTC